MTDMHPHWHSTGADAGEPVKIRIQEPATGTLRSVSRAPAAAVGIAMVLAAGFWAAGGWGLFAGQAAQPEAEQRVIIITKGGPVPEALLMEPGETVTWVNSDVGPHIVSSDTLQTASGGTLYSSAIFPGTRYSVTVPASAKDGKYPYIYVTKDTWEGAIFVKRGGCNIQEAFGGMEGTGLAKYDPCREYKDYPNRKKDTAPPPPISSSSAPVVVPPPVVQPPPPPGIIEPPEPVEPPEEIPYNPYTVASETPNPVEPVDTGKKPPTQPETGPALWVTALLSICAGAFIFRRELLAFEIRR